MLGKRSSLSFLHRPEHFEAVPEESPSTTISSTSASSLGRSPAPTRALAGPSRCEEIDDAPTGALVSSAVSSGPAASLQPGTLALQPAPPAHHRPPTSTQVAINTAKPTSPPPKRHPPRRLLVIGEPGAGKSTVVNAFRHVTAPHRGWHRAAVGRSGRYGTTSNTPYSNSDDESRRAATWVLVDTPGSVASAAAGGDGAVLQLLLRGMRFDVPLDGPRALAKEDLLALPPVPGNSPEQTVVAVSAAGLVREEVAGWWPMRRSVFAPLETAGQEVARLTELLDCVRHCQADRVPFIAVTHMDRFRDRGLAVQALCELLSRCCALTHIYFVGLQCDPHTGGGPPTLGGRIAGALSSAPGLPPGLPVLAPSDSTSTPTTTGPLTAAALPEFPAPRCAPITLGSAAPHHGAGSLPDAEGTTELLRLHDDLRRDISAYRRRAEREASCMMAAASAVGVGRFIQSHESR